MFMWFMRTHYYNKIRQLSNLNINTAFSVFSFVKAISSVYLFFSTTLRTVL